MQHTENIANQQQTAKTQLHPLPHTHTTTEHTHFHTNKTNIKQNNNDTTKQHTEQYLTRSTQRHHKTTKTPK